MRKNGKQTGARDRTDHGACLFLSAVLLRAADGDSVRALGALRDLESDFVALTQIVVAHLLKVLGVKEEIFIASLRLDEAVSSVRQTGNCS